MSMPNNVQPPKKPAPPSPIQDWVLRNKKNVYIGIAAFLVFTLILHIGGKGMAGAFQWLRSPLTLLAIAAGAAVQYMSRENP